MNFLHVLMSCTYQAVRHPRTTITHGSGPLPAPQSPAPWWISLAILVLGIPTWVISSLWSIPELGEAARLMVYGPLSYLFGRSHQIVRGERKAGREP